MSLPNASLLLIFPFDTFTPFVETFEDGKESRRLDKERGKEAERLESD